MWSEVPAGTRSFAVTFYDPDTDRGVGGGIGRFCHPAIGSHSWMKVLWEEVDCRRVPSRGERILAPPDLGACPPPGDSAHRYQMTVFALDIELLPLDEQASGAMVGLHAEPACAGESSPELDVWALTGGKRGKRLLPPTLFFPTIFLMPPRTASPLEWLLSNL